MPQHQCGDKGSMSHTGCPSAPAQCAAIVSTVTSRSVAATAAANSSSGISFAVASQPRSLRASLPRWIDRLAAREPMLAGLRPARGSHVVAQYRSGAAARPCDVGRNWRRAALARIGAQDQKLHAFVEVYDKEARLAAEAAEKAIRSGHRIGPLHGIPIALKDLIEIEGRVTTGGSQVWRERRSAYTATLAQKLIAAGLIVIGKTHTVEFAMGGWGTNQHRGTPWNPWDPEVARTPGGSSSGSGAAVAAGLAPWAIGTDTGGSVRLPASWCGLTGLKTTIGRVSTYGILPLSPTLDTPGPMARSVEDV